MPIPGRPAARSESITPKVEAQFLTQTVQQNLSKSQAKHPEQIRKVPIIFVKIEAAILVDSKNALKYA